MTKKTITKHFFALIAVLIMGLAIVGCGKDDANNASGTDGKIDTSKHVEVDLMVLGNRPVNGRLEAMLKELNEILKEKVNATLTFTYVEWADWQTQYNMQLLSGDESLDIITTATDWLYGWENTQKGAFLPLSEDMLKTYAPKTYEQVNNDGNWDIVKYEGDIYMIPEDNFKQYTNHGMFYRGDWAEAAGLENGEVSKFEDFTTYFQYILDNKDGVVPWDADRNSGEVLSGYVRSKTNYRNIIGINAGNYEFWSTQKGDSTVSSFYMEDDTIYEAAELLKEWNDMGVWRKDILNYDGDSREAMYAGLSGIDQHHTQTYITQVRPNMDEKQPGSEAKMYFFGQESENIPKDIKTHGAAAISANSQHPERALMVYDLLRNDEECYRLLNYGIEGVDYIITEDGKLDYPEGYDPSTDGLDSNFWCGRNDELELDNAFHWDGKQGVYDFLDPIAYDYEYEALIVDKNAIEANQAAIANVLSEYIPQLAWGKYEDPKAAIDEMREKVNAAGYEDVKTSIQDDMDDFLATQ